MSVGGGWSHATGQSKSTYAEGREGFGPLRFAKGGRQGAWNLGVLCRPPIFFLLMFDIQHRINPTTRRPYVSL